MPDIDLDVQVAELLGYTCLPDGRWVTPISLDWLPPYQRGLIIEDPPRFSGDLNLAWRLLDGSFAYEATLAIVEHPARFGIGCEKPVRTEDYSPEAMAEAICRAWVAFKRGR